MIVINKTHLNIIIGFLSIPTTLFAYTLIENFTITDTEFCCEYRYPNLWILNIMFDSWHLEPNGLFYFVGLLIGICFSYLFTKIFEKLKLIEIIE